MITRFHNAQVLRNHQIKREDLWIEHNKIIVPQSHADNHIDIQGMLIAPGYIDLQVNGAFGIDLSSQPDGLERVARSLPKYGVTAFLPTVISSSPDQYRTVLPALQPKQIPGGATVLGIHLEGPFFNPLYVGAHSLEFLRHCQNGLASALDCYGNLKGVRMVTLAPEIPGALNLTRELYSQNIIVSAGHSNATYEVIHAAFQEGLRSITHLFNAMVPFHHRRPGLIGAALSSGEHWGLSYSVIADNVHLHPTALQLAWKANSKGCFLITDGSAAMGLQEGRHRLGEKEIQIDKNAAYLVESQTLAGSIITMDAAVRNFQKMTNCTLIEALETATLKPAQLLGIEMHKGSLCLGADADLIILDADLNVHASWINGFRF